MKTKKSNEWRRNGIKKNKKVQMKMRLVRRKKGKNNEWGREKVRLISFSIKTKPTEWENVIKKKIRKKTKDK